MRRLTSTLALPLALAYTLLIVYASLHPFSGWRISGADVSGFLFAVWPRYYTAFDLVTNVIAYLPFGFFWCALFLLRLPRGFAFIVAFLFGACLSLSMEVTQNFLPTRVASNVDLLCNSLGALLGALAALRWGALLHNGGRLAQWRAQHMIAPPNGDYGMVLVGVWLLLQLSPENLLFGAGGLRHLFDIAPPLPFSVDGFARIETAIAAIGVLAAGLFASHMLRRPRWWQMVVLFAGALLVRALAAALLLEPAQFAHWLTDGNLRGLGIGLTLLLPLVYLPAVLRRVLAALALLALTALVNVAPDNPYLIQAAQLWYQGHFLNFNGVTRVASVLWPFCALAFLMLPQSSRSNGYYRDEF